MFKACFPVLTGRDSLKLITIWLMSHRTSLQDTLQDADNELKVSIVVAYKQARDVLKQNDFLAGTLEFESLELELYQLHASLSNKQTDKMNTRNRAYNKLTDIEKKINVYTRSEMDTFANEAERQWATLVRMSRQYCLGSQKPSHQTLGLKWSLARARLTELTPHDFDPWSSQENEPELETVTEPDEFGSNEQKTFTAEVLTFQRRHVERLTTLLSIAREEYSSSIQKTKVT